MNIKEIDNLEIRVLLNFQIHSSNIKEAIIEEFGEAVDLTRDQLLEVCRRYVYDNPEILDEFDISIK